MTISNFSPAFSRVSALSIVLAPVQAVLAFLLPAQPAVVRTSASVYRQTSYRRAMRPGDLGHAPWRAGAARTVPPGTPAIKLKAPSRLKVLREFEPGVGPALAGRMMISGRMADVCAELDRMARREQSGV